MQFFRAKNFNIFQDLKPEKFSESPLRAPTWPEKNPQKPEKIFISKINFSISEVEITDFRAEKKEKTRINGLSPLRQDKDTTFSREIQIDLTYRNTLRNVKRRVLHTLGSAMCYITRRGRCAPSASCRSLRSLSFNGRCAPQFQVSTEACGFLVSTQPSAAGSIVLNLEFQRSLRSLVSTQPAAANSIVVFPFFSP